MARKSKVLLMDANVIIDYQKSDFSVLGLVSSNIGEVYVLTTIIEEVEGLEIGDCERLGLKAIEPDLQQLIRAASKRGRLSFSDHLCLIVSIGRELHMRHERQITAQCLYRRRCPHPLGFGNHDSPRPSEHDARI